MRGRTASEKIGLFVESARECVVPPEVTHQVARAFVDTFGVAVAGRDEPASRMVRDFTTADGPGGPSSVWATTQRVRQEDAALINAVMGHVLDYDDVSLPLRGHPSVVLLPALIAVGEADGATGEQVSAAYATGFEVMLRLAEALGASHSSRGWYPTSTIGVIGATVACSHLLGLDVERAAAAVGLAVAHAAGIRGSFGTMCKSIQSANSAAAAVRCSHLAAMGFTAPRDSLDGQLGFASIYGNGEDLHPSLDRLEAPPLELVRTGLDVKQYPCAYAALRPAQGVLDLLSEHSTSAREIEQVRVTVQPGGLVSFAHKRPWTGLEGKSSIEYVVASSLLDGALRLESFTDSTVQRPEAQALLRNVEVSEEEGDITTQYRARVELELRSGERRAVRVERLRGSAVLPLTDPELEVKFRNCVAFSGLGIDPDRFLSAVWSWHDRPIREMFALL